MDTEITEFFKNADDETKKGLCHLGSYSSDSGKLIGYLPPSTPDISDNKTFVTIPELVDYFGKDHELVNVGIFMLTAGDGWGNWVEYIEE